MNLKPIDDDQDLAMTETTTVNDWTCEPATVQDWARLAGDPVLMRDTWMTAALTGHKSSLLALMRFVIEDRAGDAGVAGERTVNEEILRT